MKFSQRIVFGVALALVMSAAPYLSHAQAGDSPNDILIIVNKGTNIKNVDLDEVRELFLLTRRNWPDGSKAVPINAPWRSELRQVFRERILEMTESQEQRFWQEQQIRYGLTKPAELGANLKAVFKLKGSISYVFRSQFKEGVSNVLAVLPAQK